METFAHWLQTKMDERGYSQADLARRSGIKAASISRILNGTRNIGTEASKAIAQALLLDEDVVYRMAGLMGVKPNADETVSEITHIYHELDDDNQQDLLDYARLRLSKQGRNEKHRNSPSRTASTK